MDVDSTWGVFHAEIDVEAAAARIGASVRRTELVPFDAGDPRVELRLKLENRQQTGSFKARGATNNVLCLDAEERRAGVVACSSGNHGAALAWAAARAGVRATIVMPEDAYPNKIAACRGHGAEVVLVPDRQAADEEADRRAAQGSVFVHPYDRPGTVEGAGTVGLEIAEQWPAVEAVLAPIGGGGLIAGSSLALRRTLDGSVRVLGVEPAGAPNMHRSLAAGGPQRIDRITTEVQGLCPTTAGALNYAICSRTLDGVVLVEDEEVYRAQRRLVEHGETVEPAGAATTAAVLTSRLPAELLEGRGGDDPLRLVAVVSGGNADPTQLEALCGPA